ncbi:MAG TPA: hypothetical protein PLQ93_06565 [Bacteroidia bacterium]|nr:hypothetical protein [Bacteroidia bacterium]
MKRLFFSLALILGIGHYASAQSTQEPQKNKDTKSEQVNPDGTLKQDDKAGKAKQEDKSGTRMAITEKGIPAKSKAKSTKPAATGTAQPADNGTKNNAEKK